MNMMQTVSLTSQGQISIPSRMLKLYKIKKPARVVIKVVETGWLVEPVGDIFSLGGSLSKYAIKNKTTKEIMAMEKGAMKKAIAGEYKNG